ncbi:hypothetical protein WN51_10052 [Melipona quadrifasciata]|uniref:Uncharacterized protein n=1 Tax=Melipona quadrifasciata TaxID=166423 RepID=A0A0M9ABG7_9HYME|nr:hypothetical protein WN51_10052 [Melipona quadrifasciata]
MNVVIKQSNSIESICRIEAYLRKSWHVDQKVWPPLFACVCSEQPLLEDEVSHEDTIADRPQSNVAKNHLQGSHSRKDDCSIKARNRRFSAGHKPQSTRPSSRHPLLPSYVGSMLHSKVEGLVCCRTKLSQTAELLWRHKPHGLKHINFSRRACSQTVGIAAWKLSRTPGLDGHELSGYSNKRNYQKSSIHGSFTININRNGEFPIDIKRCRSCIIHVKRCRTHTSTSQNIDYESSSSQIIKSIFQAEQTTRRSNREGKKAIIITSEEYKIQLEDIFVKRSSSSNFKETVQSDVVKIRKRSPTSSCQSSSSSLLSPYAVDSRPGWGTKGRCPSPPNTPISRARVFHVFGKVGSMLQSVESPVCSEQISARWPGFSGDTDMLRELKTS